MARCKTPTKKGGKSKLHGRGMLDDLKKGWDNFTKHPIANQQDARNFGDKIKKGFTGGRKCKC
jgi:hypothetical protein